MSYENATIAEIIDQVDRKQIYLPAIQRKFIWREDQITKLMDSIMKGYPFGTFLFWSISKDIVNNKKYSIYEFIKDYHEKDNFNNRPAALPFTISKSNIDEAISLVLDGQQRLTSLYIALKGSITLKKINKHRSNNDAYVRKELFLNLHSQTNGEDDDNDITFEFRFLDKEDDLIIDSDNLWYKVKNILTHPEPDDVVMKLIKTKGLINNELAMSRLLQLHKRLMLYKAVNYYDVKTENIDDVLDIFVRINQGGTVLSKSDLLFSTIVSVWDKARDEIDNLLNDINGIGDGYNFSKDFVLKSCLYVLNISTALKVESFGKNNVKSIQKSWLSIRESIVETVGYLNELGFIKENILSYNIVIPIVYYRFINKKSAFQNLTDHDGKPTTNVGLEIRKFLILAQIKQIFRQSTNSVLAKIRENQPSTKSKFRFELFSEMQFSSNLSLKYNYSDIRNWVETYEKNAYTFMLLTLLYPSLKYDKQSFHQDHMHPYSAFENDKLLKLEIPGKMGKLSSEKIEEWKQIRNTLPNLQLLEGKDNSSKNDDPLEVWLNDEKNKANVKYLPENISYKLDNFDQFISKRKELIVEELCKILGVHYDQ